MRNHIGLIALSLLAASVAGCASEPQTKTAASDDPFQPLEENITGLGTACTWDSASGKLTVTVDDGEVAIIAKRVVDSAITVNGEGCTEGTPLASKVKRIEISNKDDAETEIVILDFTNGLFATGSSQASSTGIVVDLGGDAGDTLGIKTTVGADTVAYGDGVIKLNKDNYNDVTFSNVSNHTVYLGGGNDTFSSDGFDTAIEVYGGDGNDTFDQGANPTLAETIHGGAGVDTVSYASRTAGVTVTMGSGADDGDATADNGDGENDDIKDDVEVVTGSTVADDITAADGVDCTLNGGDGDDTLTGGTGDDTINGGAGDDTIDGGAGDDTLNGDADNDAITGGAGDDTLNGGTGDDTFDEGDADSGADVFNGGTGTDTVDYSARSAALHVTMDGRTADDGEYSDDGGDPATYTGEADNVKSDVENVIGGSADDELTGNSANNVLTGGAGDDTLSGGAGDDTFDEGAADSGSDVFNGGSGVDTIDYSARSNALVVTMDGVAADDGEYSDDGGDPATYTGEADNVMSDVENVEGGAGADTLTGNDSANEIVGGAGIDTLSGGAGDDVIEGGGQADVIDCGAGEGDIGFGTTGSPTNCEFGS